MSRCWLVLLSVVPLLGQGCDPAEEGPIHDLEVVDSPHSVLACVVRWTTDEPATSRVEFGEDDELTFFIEQDEEVTEHEVVVFGLHELASYRLEAVSVDGSGTEARSDPLTYETLDLPFTSGVFELTELREDLVQPGWTLTNLVVDGLLSPTVVLALDMDARVVWYHQMGPDVTFADVEVTQTAAGRLLVGGDLAPGVAPVEVTWEGQVRWEGIAQPEGLLAPGAHHHTFRKLASGHYLTLTFDEHAGTVVDIIEELDGEGTPVWQWHAVEHIDEAATEHIHGNMALADLEQDVAYFNSLVLDAFFKIDRADGAVLWRFGEEGDFAMLTEHEWPWIDHSHAPQILPDGNVLLYDNGIYPDRPMSRVIEYELDEEAMTASIAWEYPGELADDPWFTSFWGDADRLANGNTLVTAGSVLEFDTPSTLFEVTADGAKAWQVMVTSETEAAPAGWYASERVACPLGEI